MHAKLYCLVSPGSLSVFVQRNHLDYCILADLQFLKCSLAFVLTFSHKIQQSYIAKSLKQPINSFLSAQFFERISLVEDLSLSFISPLYTDGTIPPISNGACN